MGKNKMVPESENDFLKGLQTAFDSMKFRLSEVGREIINEIIKKHEEILALFEEGMRLARQEQIESVRLQAYLQEKDEKKDQQEPETPNLIKPKAPEINSPPPPEPKTDPYDDMLKSWDKKIEELETKKSNAQLEYSRCEKSLEAADNFEITAEDKKFRLRDVKLADLDDKDKAASSTSLREKLYGADGNSGLKLQLEQALQRAEQDWNAGFQADDTEKMQKSREDINRIKEQRWEFVQLDQMLSVIDGKTQIYKNDGTQASSFAEADFFVKSNQQLIKEGNDFYLLDKIDKNGNPIELNDDNRQEGKQNFEYANKQVCSLNELLQDSKLIDMAEIESELQQTRAKRQEVQSAQKLQREPNVSQPAGNMRFGSDTSETPMGDINKNSDKLDIAASSEGYSSGTKPDDTRELQAEQQQSARI